MAAEFDFSGTSLLRDKRGVLVNKPLPEPNFCLMMSKLVKLFFFDWS